MSGYEDAARLFGTLDDPKSPEFSRFLPLLKGAVGDANAVAQEKGLCAVLAFVEGSQCAGRACGDVLAALVAKALAAPRTRTRELALAVALAYVEAERQETVLEELLKGLDNKNPKIVAACVGALRECLRLFGAGVVAPKPLFKALPKVRLPPLSVWHARLADSKRPQIIRASPSSAKGPAENATAGRGPIFLVLRHRSPGGLLSEPRRRRAFVVTEL